MKKIEAIIRPDKLSAVLVALGKIGYAGVSVTEIQGHGKQKGVMQQWQGDEVRIALLPKVKIEIIAQDVDADIITGTIVETAKTSEVGDGKIFISPVSDVVRIRTGEQGVAAI